jgi:hypothetical protein
MMIADNAFIKIIGKTKNVYTRLRGF